MKISCILAGQKLHVILEDKLAKVNAPSPDLWVMVATLKVCKHCCEGCKLWDIAYCFNWKGNVSAQCKQSNMKIKIIPFEQKKVINMRCIFAFT